MAQLVIAAAGAAIGGAIAPVGFSFLGMSGAGLGWGIGSLIGSAFGPKQKSSGPRQEDLKVTGNGYGVPVPWVAGSPRVGGTIIWASDKRETATTTEVGKGGGAEYTEYTYDCDVLYLLSENEITSVSRIWSNGKLIYDGANIQEGFCDSITVYTGASDQLPDPIYETAVGAGNAPAYRTRGTIMIAGLKLGSSGFLPNLTFEIGVGSTPGISDVAFLINPDYGSEDPQAPPDESTYALPAYDGGIYYQINRAGVNVFGTGDQLYNFGWPVPTPAWNADISFTFEGQSFIGDNEPKFFVRLISAISGFRFLSERTTSTASRLKLEWPTPTGVDQIYGSEVELPSFTLPVNSWYTYSIEYIATTRTIKARVNNSVVLEASGITVATAPVERFDVYICGTEAAGVNKVKTGSARITVGRARFNINPSYQTPAYPTAMTDDSFEILGGTETLIPISNVVDLLMIRAGYNSDEYNISDLINSQEAQIRALYLSQVATTRSALEILQSAYYLTCSKSDKIYFKYREITPSGTFDYHDLGVSDSPESLDNPFPIKNTNVLEQPSQISLTYNNMSFDFNQDVASSDILVTDQKSTNAMQIPLGMLPSEAKGVVESMLLDQVAARVQYGPFRLPLSYAQYEPSDVVIIPDTVGSEHRVRLIKKTDMGIMLEFEGVGDDEGALIAAGIADDTDQGQTVIEQVSGSLWIAGDWPLMRDADNNAGYLTVAKSKGDGDFWPGAQFVRSWDDVSFSQVATFTSGCIFGTCTTTLPNFTGGNVWDESSIVRVNVGSGELSSSTKSAMQTDLTINTAMIGSECIRFRTATLVSAGVYDLSSLIRGFRGTEWAIDGHISSEDFVLLDSSSRRVNLNTSQINVDQYVKAVTFNLPLSSETSELFNYTGINLKPFSVANPRALYSIADDGLVITWDRRTRLSYSYGGTSGVIVPLGESFERYRLRFYDGSTHLRTETVNDAQTFTYTETMANEDGLSSNAIVTIEIVQVSEIVGDGYPEYVEGMMA